MWDGINNNSDVVSANENESSSKLGARRVQSYPLVVFECLVKLVDVKTSISQLIVHGGQHLVPVARLHEVGVE